LTCRASNQNLEFLFDSKSQVKIVMNHSWFEAYTI
jgi:hypothetical protein